MFYCKAGHRAEPHTTKILVPVRYRLVETTHNIKCPDPKKSWFTVGQGKEIVKEEAFCWVHANDVEVEYDDLVHRTQTLIKTKCSKDDK